MTVQRLGTGLYQTTSSDDIVQVLMVQGDGTRPLSSVAGGDRGAAGPRDRLRVTSRSQTDVPAPR